MEETMTMTMIRGKKEGILEDISHEASKKMKKLNIKTFSSTFRFTVILALPFFMAGTARSQGIEPKKEIQEKYRLMYEKMKQDQKKKSVDAGSEADEERLRRERNKQKAMDLVRKRQEEMKKAEAEWLNKYRQESALLKNVDTPPDLTRLPGEVHGMTYIPAGKFMRGQDWGEWPDSQPSMIIYVSSYYIDTYEVTVGQYKAYLQEIKKPIPVSLKDEDLSGDNQPVFKVTWQNAVDYCSHYGKRLPTEAEWEKAARGWDNRYYPWGSALPDENGQYRANYAPGEARGFDGFLYTAEVGSFGNGVSPYGVHDMAGNISEWTADWYDAEYYKVKIADDPKGPESGTEKVVRGGGYDVEYHNLLLTVRIAAPPATSDNFTGFRCAKDAKER